MTIRAVLGVGLLAAALFVPAGTVAWPMGWAYLMVATVSMVGTVVWLLRTDPALIVERTRWHRDAMAWDKVLAPLIAVVLPLILLVVAGLDRRFGWSSILTSVQVVALLGVVAGYGVIVAAMGANTFFSGVVRIQAERGHRVVTGGPYALVRHPGYVGAIAAQVHAGAGARLALGAAAGGALCPGAGRAHGVGGRDAAARAGGLRGLRRPRAVPVDPRHMVT